LGRERRAALVAALGAARGEETVAGGLRRLDRDPLDQQYFLQVVGVLSQRGSSDLFHFVFTPSAH